MATDPGHRTLALGTILAAFPGTTPPDWAAALLADGLAGYTLFGRNVADPAQLARLTGQLRAARADVLLAIDEEGGDVTRLAHRTGSPYPGNAALGVVDDPSLTGAVYRAIGAQLTGCGVNLNLAPTVDVNTTDDNPIIGTRSFGADQARVSTHAAAAVAGLQATGVAACAKHFPGHGATSTDSHLTLPVINDPLALLRSRDLPPFAAAIDAGCRVVMTAHIRVPELTGADPATFSRAALVDLLRDEYGFTGVVLTDALEMAGAAATAGGIEAAAVRALAAGADLLCLGADVDAGLTGQVADAIAAAITSGALPLARVEQAAARTAALAAWATPAAGGLHAGHTAGTPAVASSGTPGVSPTTPESATGTTERGTPSEGAPVAVDPAALGYQIARRAIAVEGPLPPLTDPLVVQVESGSTIAEGAVPWGLAPLLPGVVRVAAEEASLDGLRERAGDRPVVVVGRHLHRRAASRALVEKLATDHPTVVVEMGWPSTWRPAGARAFITTHGASRANGTALADVLSLSPTPEAPVTPLA